MVRPMAIIHVSTLSSSPAALAIALFVSATLLVGLCARHARKILAKHGTKARDPNAAKQLIATISHKDVMGNIKENKNSVNKEDEEEEEGVWQKAILMGEKCEPPEFSGVIYYDVFGNRISEMPKSPRATSMSPLRSFTFPVQKEEDSVH